MFNIHQANFKPADLLDEMALVQSQWNRTVTFRGTILKQIISPNIETVDKCIMDTAVLMQTFIFYIADFNFPHTALQIFTSPVHLYNDSRDVPYIY